MQDPARAIVELRRCINELGLVGVQISSHVNEWNLNAPELFPIFEEAEKLGAVIFVHPWDMMGEQDMKEFWLPWLVGMPAETTRAVCSMIFGGVFERLPKLKVCFAHGAGAFCFTLGRIEHGFNCRPDLVAIKNNVPPSNYLGKFWVDSLTHDSDMLYHLVKKCGKDKIILGSDYPFPLGEQEPGKLIDEMTEIDDQTKALLLGKNCLEFMGLSEEKFL
jgi:aminocarboxymuconate-semialdehyde decarboxylase